MSRSLEPASKAELCISSDTITNNRWFHITVWHFSDVQEFTTCHKRWTVLHNETSNRFENLRSAFAQETAEQLVSIFETSPVRLCQAVRNRRSAYFRIATESQSNHSHITPESQPNRLPNHSHITGSSHKTADSQPNLSLSVILPINLIQFRRNRRSACFKLWDFAEPCVSSSGKSPTRWFQNHRRISQLHSHMVRARKL